MRLATDGKLKKSVLTLYNDGIQPPFDLPATWDWVCLGDVAQYGIADKVKSNREIEPETWVLDLEDIEKDTSRLIDHVLSSARPFRSTKTVFKLGDVLFGKLRPYLNKVVVADIDGVCSTEIVPIRGYCNMVPEYIKLVFMSPLTMRRVDRLMYGMKMPRLGTNDAISLEFPLAPFADQRRIVAKVDELMALCDQLEAAKNKREQSRDRLVAASLHSLNPPADDEANTPEALREQARFIFNNLPRLTTRPAHIKQLRQTILNLAVRGKLVAQDPNDEPAAELLKRIQAEKSQLKSAKKEKSGTSLSDDSFPFPVPECWRWSQLAEIGLISPRNSSDGDTLASFVPMTLISAEYGIPHTHEVRSWNEFKTGYTHFAEGDVGLAKITPCFENGKSTVFRGLTAGFGAGTTELHIVRPLLIDADYILVFLKSPFFIESGIPLMTGTAGQKRVSSDYFAYSPFPLPPLAEQHRIVAKVDELMALCDQLEAQLTTTQTDSRRLLEAVLHEALAPVQEEAA